MPSGRKERPAHKLAAGAVLPSSRRRAARGFQVSNGELQNVGSTATNSRTSTDSRRATNTDTGSTASAAAAETRLQRQAGFRYRRRRARPARHGFGNRRHDRLSHGHGGRQAAGTRQSARRAGPGAQSANAAGSADTAQFQP